MNSITRTKPLTNSALRKNGDVPTLRQMELDGQKSLAKIRRASQESLQEWFAQSERLNIARGHYKMKGDRFIDFAKRIGVDKSSAYNLVKLYQHRAAITSRCLDEAEKAAARGEPFCYPGWLTALSWFETIKKAHKETPTSWQHRSDEWQSPQPLLDFLKQFYSFDVDVCASPENAKCKKFFTKKDNGLKKEWKAGQTHWMNPPYSRAGEWVSKAAKSAKEGAIVIGLLANRSSSGWYRDHVAPNALVVLLHGRVAYTTAGDLRTNMSSAPFASILAIWPKKAGDRLLKYCQPVQTVLLAIPDSSQPSDE